MPDPSHLRRVRICMAIVIAGLLVSGVTAFPLETEQHGILALLRPLGQSVPLMAPLVDWLGRVYTALAETNARYPFLAYGTDWLAFAHLVLAVLFVGPWIDPVRNKWVVDFGLIACVGVLLLALIAGPVRGIPFGWRLIDCSFGVFGSLPLIVCRRSIMEMERDAALRG